MFIDEVKFKVKAGDGGNGVVSFRREKFESMGGPNGGDGGDGGNIIFEVDEGLHTLADLRYDSIYRAENGSNGSGQNKRGRDGEDMVLRVPPGTMIYDDRTDKLLADLKENGERLIAARGGEGGRGNARFTKSTRRAPRFAEKGKKGEKRSLRLELKVLADVGLIGYPNVGKSTLISRVSQARPQIASYHFTTRSPNLGVVSYGEYKSFVMADIPGLIPGAHKGVGLGDEFLRHLARTRLLIHVLDVSGIEGRDPLEDFEVINEEVKKYSTRLASLSQIIALNKIDLPVARENIPRVQQALEEEEYQTYPISAVTGEGVQDLIYKTGQLLEELPPPEESEPVKEGVVLKEDFQGAEEILVKRTADKRFEVYGQLVDDLIEKTDFENEAAVKRLLRILRHHGLYEILRKKSVSEGDTVVIGPVEYHYLE